MVFPRTPPFVYDILYICGFHGFSIATFDYRRVYLINFLCSLVKSLFNALNHLSSNQETNRTAVSTMLVRRLNAQAPRLLVVLHLCGGCQKNDWLVVFTILKNMKVSWEGLSQYIYIYIYIYYVKIKIMFQTTNQPLGRCHSHLLDRSGSRPTRLGLW